MLKYFRKKNIAKFVFWVLVILILPAFVLWGAGSLSRSRERGTSFVGIVNKKKVSFDELYESMAGIRSQLILNFFNQEKILDAFLKNKPLIATLAWDRLIMLREAKTHKIKIPDKDVINYIRSHPLFLRNGDFDSKIYEYILRYNMGLSARTFEEIVRENLAVQRLKEIITKEITVTDEEILEGYKKENEKFDEERFKKEKTEFAKKCLEEKKAKVLDAWFIEISLRAKLNLNLEDIEKYYR